MMDWLISSAYAQAAPAAGAPQGGNLSFLIMMGGLFALMYFMIIRPQSKRAKEHRAMIAALEVGTEVVTAGGILGKVTETSDQFLTIAIAEGVQVKVQRHTVSQVLPKGTIKGA
jgi:preprotein translocase subunit YajC